MKFELCISDALPVLLERYVQRKLSFALSHYGNRIANVSVRLSDGSNPGESKCRMVAELTPFGNVEVEERDVDLFGAIDRAAGRLRHRLVREMDRVRNLQTTRKSIRIAA
ncbi:MAG: hypothetical protein CXZ00_03410 [Acidobacteria bacterium]|nr:MAG: hypothetical protein CXZ00_03410 [Acidobacteriota bacterium]